MSEIIDKIMIKYKFPNDATFMEMMEMPENKCPIIVDNRLEKFNHYSSKFVYDLLFKYIRMNGVNRGVFVNYTAVDSLSIVDDSLVQDNELRSAN